MEPPLEDKPPSPPPAHRSWWQRLLVDGPDPVDPNRPEDAGRLDTLLTWPVRWLAVVGALIVGRIWAHSPAGVQLGWALQYSLLVAVSIVSSLWFPVLLVNLAVACAWLYVSWRPPAPRPPGAHAWDASDVVTWLNRQIGHGEAIATWITVAIVSSNGLILQLGGVAAVVFVGPPAINWLARRNFVGGAVARRSRADLMMERRVVIYAATLVGLVLLLAKAPRQYLGLLPLVSTVLPGIVVRVMRNRRRRQHERSAAPPAATALEGLSPQENPVRAARTQKAELQIKVDGVVGWIGPAVVVASIGALAGFSVWQTGRLAHAQHDVQDGPPPPADACAAEEGGPAEPTIAMFILSDTQLHQLGGGRFPGQLEVASALVPVCRRPVELDMLSTAAVVHYEGAYEKLAGPRRKPGVEPLWWAHLGDFADLSCASEMTRMVALLSRGMGPNERRLAGVAPGNHDSTFQGNFAWSPYWDVACDDRLDKKASDKKLEELLERLPDKEAETGTVQACGPQALVHLRSPPARYTVTRLGALGDPKHQRGVLGVFIDTSDQLAEDYGIAGSYGAFSGAQRKAVLKAIGKQAPAGDATWSDPWFVIFGHIPYADLTSGSQGELTELITTLDARGQCGEADTDCTHSRVIAFVSAHTHVAESHRHCMGTRLVREIVVGSVIDPPQQAALLELGLDARGRGAARLSTLPSVARDGFTCAANDAVPASVCRQTIATLSLDPACRDLVAGIDRDAQPAQSCEDLERPLSLGAQIEGIAQRGGPTDPGDLKSTEETRARALIRCVCRNPLPNKDVGALCEAAQAQPLADATYGAAIEALARDENHDKEMTCLSWAAAAVQAHKAAGMTMADALHCAFDDPTLPPAQVTVAAAKDVPCY